MALFKAARRMKSLMLKLTRRGSCFNLIVVRVRQSQFQPTRKSLILLLLRKFIELHSHKNS